MERLKEILFDLFNQYEDVEDIIEDLRSLNTCEEITDNEYDVIMKNYEKWLQEYESQENNKNKKGRLKR